MAGIIGLRAEDMDQVDALQRARADFPHGLPMVRPHVRALALVRSPAGVLEAVPARFGFSRRFPSMNARMEKLTESPLWRGLFGKSHAIIPISYVIEWKGSGESKQPYLIQRRKGLIFAPALIGGYHEDKTERAFAICTRPPNHFFGYFHDRMVGMCTPPQMEMWLDPAAHTREELMTCIAAPADDELEAVPTDPKITARQKGDWSPLAATGKPLRWGDVEKA